MSTTNEKLGQQVKQVTEDLRAMGGTVRDAAQEKLEQAAQSASQCCEQGRAKAHGPACACEQFLRTKPLTSVLLAAGVGWLLGRFWNRR